jgi:hypothetical protein
MFTQVVYMSAATRVFDVDELTDLLTAARLKNERLGLTGLLLYHMGSFLQVLEGDGDTVDRLYRRIEQDQRHTRMVLLVRSQIEQRNFSHWQMGFVHTDRLARESLPGFHDVFSRTFSVNEFIAQPTIAHKLLLAFRQGEWRQKVDTTPPAAHSGAA